MGEGSVAGRFAFLTQQRKERNMRASVVNKIHLALCSFSVCVVELWNIALRLPPSIPLPSTLTHEPSVRPPSSETTTTTTTTTKTIRFPPRPCSK